MINTTVNNIQVQPSQKALLVGIKGLNAILKQVKFSISLAEDHIKQKFYKQVPEEVSDEQVRIIFNQIANMLGVNISTQKPLVTVCAKMMLDGYQKHVIPDKKRVIKAINKEAKQPQSQVKHQLSLDMFQTSTISETTTPKGPEQTSRKEELKQQEPLIDFNISDSNIYQFKTTQYIIQHPMNDMKVECRLIGEFMNHQPHGLTYIEFINQVANNHKVPGFKAFIRFQDGIPLEYISVVINGAQQKRQLIQSINFSGLINGKSRQYMENSSVRYIGEYQNSEFHGLGRLYRSDGDQFYGLFEQGMMKEGVQIQKDGIQLKLVFDCRSDIQKGLMFYQQQPIIKSNII